MNIDFKIFFDTFLSYFSFGLHKENLYFIALQFKNNIFYFFIISCAGFLLAIILNYFIGFFVKKVAIKEQERNSFINFLVRFSSYVIFFSIFNGFASQIF